MDCVPPDFPGMGRGVEGRGGERRGAIMLLNNFVCAIS